MSVCTIAFCLANLYVNVEVAEAQHTPKDSQNPNVHQEGYWCGHDYCKGNPVTVKVGMPVYLGRNDILLYYGFKHTSFLQDRGDSGQNSWFVSFTYMPFAR